jgi:hypothetical protein
MDKEFDDSLFDADVEVKFNESGWATRLARHQKLVARRSEFHIGPEVGLPPLTGFRMNNSTGKKQSANAAAKQQKKRSSVQNRVDPTTNAMEDTKTAVSAVNAAVSSSTQNIAADKAAMRALRESLRAQKNVDLPQENAWIPWKHFAKRINRKTREFARTHDERAAELSNNLEKIAGHRNDSFKETWVIVNDMIREGMEGGDVTLKVQNEIHHRRNARNRNLSEWAREWYAERPQLEDDAEHALETEKLVWARMKR